MDDLIIAESARIFSKVFVASYRLEMAQENQLEQRIMEYERALGDFEKLDLEFKLQFAHEIRRFNRLYLDKKIYVKANSSSQHTQQT
jgi:hypothetical protein